MPTLEQLHALLATDPTDPFIRYGLAMEHLKLGQPTMAIAQFDILLERDPAYIPALFMYGRALTQLGDLPAARAMYQRGIAAAQAAGDAHAAAEMTQALSELPS